jgi:hypothetical protein
MPLQFLAARPGMSLGFVGIGSLNYRRKNSMAL